MQNAFKLVQTCLVSRGGKKTSNFSRKVNPDFFADMLKIEKQGVGVPELILIAKFRAPQEGICSSNY